MGSIIKNAVGKYQSSASLGMFLAFCILLPVSFAPYVLEILLVIGLVVGVYSITLLIKGHSSILYVIFASIVTMGFLAILLSCWLENNEQALTIAIMKGDLHKIEQLLLKEYDINTKGGALGGTTLHTAITYDYRPRGGVFAHLKIREKNEKDKEVKITQMLKILLDNEANINALDNQGYTPLALSVRRNLMSAVKILLERGADVNLKNRYANTPLHLAIQPISNIEIVELLLENGADVHIKDNNGNTPIDIAEEQGNKEIVELLSKYKADSP